MIAVMTWWWGPYGQIGIICMLIAALIAFVAVSLHVPKVTDCVVTMSLLPLRPAYWHGSLGRRIVLPRWFDIRSRVPSIGGCRIRSRNFITVSNRSKEVKD